MTKSHNFGNVAKCQRKITIEERDQIFEEIRLQVIDKYQLKTLNIINKKILGKSHPPNGLANLGLERRERKSQR